MLPPPISLLCPCFVVPSVHAPPLNAHLARYRSRPASTSRMPAAATGCCCCKHARRGGCRSSSCAIDGLSPLFSIGSDKIATTVQDIDVMCAFLRIVDSLGGKTPSPRSELSRFTTLPLSWRMLWTNVATSPVMTRAGSMSGLGSRRLRKAQPHGRGFASCAHGRMKGTVRYPAGLGMLERLRVVCAQTIWRRERPGW